MLFHALLTSYEMAAAEAEELRKLEWGALVVDEGHRLKNKEARARSLGCRQAYVGGGCQRSELAHWEPVAQASSHRPLRRRRPAGSPQARLFQALKGIRAQHRLLLTGTPLQVGGRLGGWLGGVGRSGPGLAVLL